MPTNEKKRRIARQQSLFLVLLLLAVFAGLFYFQKHLDQRGRVLASFESPNGERTMRFSLEVADTEAARRKGLMFRKEGELASNEGMLFIFPRSGKQEFWMKNTFLSLDMIFIDNDGDVVGVIEKVPPLSEEKRSINRDSRMVVELLAGSVDRHGISVGDRFVPNEPLIQLKGGAAS